MIKNSAKTITEDTYKILVCTFQPVECNPATPNKYEIFGISRKAPFRNILFFRNLQLFSTFFSRETFFLQSNFVEVQNSGLQANNVREKV